MNCEKFDHNLMDALYDELDEVTRAAMKRHAEGCPRCAALESGMRAVVEVGVLPLEEPSEELELRILESARRAEQRAPWHRKVIQTIAWAGSHAMRPQLAMAALLVLVLGSSLLLLRARPGTMGVTPVKVTEQGVPHPSPAATSRADGVGEAERRTEGLAAGAEAAPAGAEGAAQDRAADADATVVAGGPESADGGAHAGGGAGQSGDEVERFDRGVSNYRAGKLDEAQRDFAEVSKLNGERAPLAALYEARVVRSQSGCRASIGHYDAVRRRFGGSSAAADATWEQADCHRILGEVAQAEQLWRELESSASYRDRAAGELAGRGQVAGASRPAAAKSSGTKTTAGAQNNQGNQSNQSKTPQQAAVPNAPPELPQQAPQQAPQPQAPQ